MLWSQRSDHKIHVFKFVGCIQHTIFTFTFFPPFKLHLFIWVIFTHNTEDPISKSGAYEYSLPLEFHEKQYWLSTRLHARSRPDINLRWIIFHWCKYILLVRWIQLINFLVNQKYIHQTTEWKIKFFYKLSNLCALFLSAWFGCSNGSSVNCTSLFE